MWWSTDRFFKTAAAMQLFGAGLMKVEMFPDYTIPETLILSSPNALIFGASYTLIQGWAMKTGKSPMMAFMIASPLSAAAAAVPIAAIDQYWLHPEKYQQEQPAEKPVISILDANAEEMLEITQSGPAYICKSDHPALNG